jgi:hypothetical protein
LRPSTELPPNHSSTSYTHNQADVLEKHDCDLFHI